MLDANQSCEKAAVCKNIKQEQRITQSNEQLVTEQHHQAEEKKKKMHGKMCKKLACRNR
jgi:hypothetical protein